MLRILRAFFSNKTGVSMPLRFLGRSDGRLSRALRAIRKLVVLGFDKHDVLKLMRFERRLRTERVEKTRVHQGRDQHARRARAQSAIRSMMRLGFTESEIAAMAGVHPTTVAHALDPSGLRAIGEDTARALKETVQGAGAERLNLLLPHVEINVLDTCCDKGRQLDDATRGDIGVNVRTGIRNALVLSSAPAPFVPGIRAFLAQIGDPVHGLYVVGAPLDGETTPKKRLEHLLLVEHELEHLVQRFRERRRRLEGELGRNTDPPNGGRIA